MRGIPTASKTDFTVAAASSGPLFSPSGSHPASLRQTRSAPNSSTHFFAHLPGSSHTSEKCSPKISGQSLGVISRTSMVTTGRWGIFPSKWRKGKVVEPPTVTVRVLVPPSFGVAPIVMVLMGLAHFCFTSGISILNPPLRSYLPFVFEKAGDSCCFFRTN